MDKEFKIGDKTFLLNEEKAMQAYHEKQVINGRDTMTFNLLPLKYQWAYDLYRKMKANHWEPEDVPMQKDVEQWKSQTELSDAERWIVMMGIRMLSRVRWSFAMVSWTIVPWMGARRFLLMNGMMTVTAE